MDETVLVDARGAARKIEALSMKCDAKEIPESLSGAKPDGWWIAAMCAFEGKAATGGETGVLNDPVDMSIGGQAALALAEGRVLGIMSPMSQAEPALWWAWPVASLKVESDGARGLFTKRPTSITLKHANAVITLGHVGRLYRQRVQKGFQAPQIVDRMKGGQEGSLFQALGG